MDLIKSYNELYATSKTFNELMEEKTQEQKRFSDLEAFLKQNSNEIRKYGLEADICKKIQKNEISIELVESLILAKREEERLLREQKEYEKLRKNKIIKWAIIVIASIVSILTLFAIPLWIIFGIVLYQKPDFRKKISESIKADWAIINGNNYGHTQ